jgi:oxaloacetate decarboxylase alpha subunit
MKNVSLIDVSLRDGNQSIWGATGVTNRTIRKMAPLLDRCGYEALELLTSTLIATAVRYHREDPFARLDLARRLAPTAKLGFLTTGRRFITFGLTPKTVLRLAYDLLRRHGVTRMWVVDPMSDMNSTRENARLAKEVGFEEVIAGVCFTLSPVHTDEFYASKAAELDDCPHIDAIYIKDPSGLLTPQRLETLLPKLRAGLKRLKIDEIHTHSSTGLAPLTLLTAADLGMTKLHCALPPVANGSSHSNALQLVHNLRARGHQVQVDLEAMAAASDALKREARLFNLPEAAPVEYDESYYRHTLAGGVLSTTRRQLAEIGRGDLAPRLTEEAVRVREDLGWPIVVTPFAQYIVAQATLNLITGERYSRLSDEIVDLLLGDFGPMPGVVNPELIDRALQTPRARNRGAPPEEPTLADLRQRFGQHLSDEDLLLRAVMPAEQVDGMIARRDRAESGGLADLLEALASGGQPYSLSIKGIGADLSLSPAANTGVRA